MLGGVRLHFFRRFGDRDGVNVCSEKSNIRAASAAGLQQVSGAIGSQNHLF